MDYLVCNLWLVLLAAALACLIVWMILRLSSPTEGDGGAHQGVPSILWMTPASRAALGACAEPRRLRKMSYERMATLLAGAIRPEDEPPPTERQVKTWPLQASMLVARDYESLRDWQRRWADGEEVNEQPGGNVRPWRPYPRGVDAWLVAALFLLVASITLLLAHERICRTPSCPACGEDEPDEEAGTVRPPPPPPPPPVTRLELSTDMLFDYKLDRFHSDQHEAALRSRLFDLFRRLEGIQIQSIEGHTDPIGGTEENRRLGQSRAESVRRVLSELMEEQELAGRFSPNRLPAPSPDSGAKREDAAIWQECFRRYQLNVPNLNFRPLRDLHPRFNRDNRPLCSSATTANLSPAGFPACASLYDRSIPTSLRVFALQAENFREMTACLSPMRHVVLKFPYDRQVPSRTNQS